MSAINSIGTPLTKQDKSQKLCKKHNLPINSESGKQRKHSCLKCYLEEQSLKISEFKIKATEIHNGKYD